MRCVLVALGIVCLAPGPAAAQRPSALRVGADNDAFNFWQPPWERTDQEYTSGVRGALVYDGRSPILGALMRRIGPPCEPNYTCATHAFTLGQKIFTTPPAARASTDPNAPGPLRTRTNAGWLYVQASERDSSAESATELSIAIGVVGPPALGETMQRLFHSIVPEYQRPVDWTHQLPFEPGFVARYTRTIYSRPWVNSAAWRVSGFTSFGGALGTILTEGAGGAGLRAEARLPGADRWSFVPRLELSADGHVRGIVRDEFLDGAFFRKSERVPRNPTVFEQSAGVALRWRRLSVSYQVNHVGKQYSAQPADATWGALSAEWRLSR